VETPLPAQKTIVFFDLPTHYGGAQAATVPLACRLQRYYDMHFVDAYGASERFLQHVQAVGLRNHIVRPQKGPTYFGYYDRPLVRLFRIVRQTPDLWRTARALRKLLDDLAPDLIWVQAPKALLLLALSGAARHVPVAYYAHAWHRRGQFSPQQRWLIRHLADELLAVSTATGAALEQWGILAERIHVVYNYIDFDEVLSGAARPLAQPLPGLDKRPRILVPGTLLVTKGQHTAIRAAGLWKQQGADFSMWLAGDRPPGARDRFAELLHDLVRQYGLQENVHFLGWRSDVPAIMAQADIVLLPTHTEGLPRVVEEAMLLRKPVITTPVGGMGDLIIDGQTGLLAPVEDERAVCAALARLAGDSTLAQDLVQRAEQRVRELLEPAREVDRVREAFEVAMSRGPRPRWSWRRLRAVAG
jgi:glycosyltransferase involved in cell wall biosynthesis